MADFFINAPEFVWYAARAWLAGEEGALEEAGFPDGRKAAKHRGRIITWEGYDAYAQDHAPEEDEAEDHAPEEDEAPEPLGSLPASLFASDAARALAEDAGLTLGEVSDIEATGATGITKGDVETFLALSGNENP